MCLDILTEKYDPPLLGLKEGWKVFRFDAFGLEFEYFEYLQIREKWRSSKIGQWIKSTNTAIHINSKEYYHSGFHIFDFETHAIHYNKHNKLRGWCGIGANADRTIIKVQYDEVVACGFQDGYSLTVARKLYIPNSKELNESI